MASDRKNFYGVREGRIRGVYDDWDVCKAQVEGCESQYRGFDTRFEAEFYVATGETRDTDAGKKLFFEWARTRPPGSCAINPSQRPPPPEEERNTPVTIPSQQPQSIEERKALVTIPSQQPQVVEEKKTPVTIPSQQPREVKRFPAIKNEPIDSSQSFFSQVPNFRPNDSASFDDEFGRFASSQNIAPGSSAWKRKRADAIRHEMIFHYGQAAASNSENNGIKTEDRDDSNLSVEEEERRQKLLVYQNMCREANLEPLDTLEGCIANLKSVLVNIVDYIDAKRLGQPIKVWDPDDFEAFKKYTLGFGKTISLDEAKRGDGLLEPLLQVLRPKRAGKTYKNRIRLAEVAREDHATRAANKTTNAKTAKGLAVIKEEEPSPSQNDRRGHKHEAISIHGSDSESASPPRTAKVKTEPLSQHSLNLGSAVGASNGHQTGIKRELDEYGWDDEWDILDDEGTMIHEVKRRRA